MTMAAFFPHLIFYANLKAFASYRLVSQAKKYSAGEVDTQ